MLAELARQQGAGRQRDQHAGLALPGAQSLATVRAVTLLGDEIDARRGPADVRGAGDPGAGPASQPGLFEEER